MSWMNLDDRILEHPKFIRAERVGGSEAIHLWLGLRAYCGQHLTDGFVPSDMLSEVRGPRFPKRRAEAMTALRTSGLIVDVDGGVQLHDFLQWSESREKVLERRERARLRQDRHRAKSQQPATASVASVTRLSRRDERVTAPSVTLPSPLLSSPHHSTEREGRAGAPVESVTERVTDEPVKLTAEDRYAQAWARGVSSATANPCSVPAAKARGSINTSTQTHFTGLRGDALLQAIEASATQYVKAKPKDASYGGFTPAKWLTWLDSGRPSEVTAVRGRASVQPTDMSAPWMQPGYGETLGKTGGDQ